MVMGKSIIIQRRPVHAYSNRPLGMLHIGEVQYLRSQD
jgi:hypothetical protein